MNNIDLRLKTDELWSALEILDLLKLEIVDYDIFQGDFDYHIRRDENEKVAEVSSLTDYGYFINLKAKKDGHHLIFPRWRFYDFLVNYARAYADDETKKKISSNLDRIGIQKKKSIDLQLSNPEEKKEAPDAT